MKHRLIVDSIIIVSAITGIEEIPSRWFREEGVPSYVVSQYVKQGILIPKYRYDEESGRFVTYYRINENARLQKTTIYRMIKFGTVLNPAVLILLPDDLIERSAELSLKLIKALLKLTGEQDKMLMITSLLIATNGNMLSITIGADMSADAKEVAELLKRGKEVLKQVAVDHIENISWLIGIVKSVPKSFVLNNDDKRKVADALITMLGGVNTTVAIMPFNVKENAYPLIICNKYGVNISTYEATPNELLEHPPAIVDIKESIGRLKESLENTDEESLNTIVEYFGRLNKAVEVKNGSMKTNSAVLIYEIGEVM